MKPSVLFAGLGSTIGQGNGAIAAGVVGAVAGALIGNSIEANNMRAQQAAIPNCTTETSYENRTVGYDVFNSYSAQVYGQTGTGFGTEAASIKTKIGQ